MTRIVLNNDDTVSGIKITGKGMITWYRSDVKVVSGRMLIQRHSRIFTRNPKALNRGSCVCERYGMNLFAVWSRRDRRFELSVNADFRRRITAAAKVVFFPQLQ